MVLTQIYLQAADFANGNPSLYQINTWGQKHIVLLGISYVQTNAATTKTIGLQSNLLRVTRGPFPYFIFSTAQSNFIVSPGQTDIAFDSNVNGNLDLNLVDVATNAFPANFVSCIVYLDVQDIPNEPLPVQHYKHEHPHKHHQIKHSEK